MKLINTIILGVALTPTIVYNMFKYRTKQRNAFEQHK